MFESRFLRVIYNDYNGSSSSAPSPEASPPCPVSFCTISSFASVSRDASTAGLSDTLPYRMPMVHRLQ
jgi:hypothetical protein